MTAGEFVAASAARPDVFHADIRIGRDGLNSSLIDGGVICENPTLYAYGMAKYLYKQ